jgi:hypothetical protein
LDQLEHEVSLSELEGTDGEGMTHRVLIFGLCGFKPRSKTDERMIKAHIYIRLAQSMK